MTASEVILAAIAALTSGGGIVAGLRTWSDHRKGVRESDAERSETALDGFRSLVADLRTEVDRLKQDREQDRGRIDRIERQITVERDLRWSAIQYVRTLLAWVSTHVPAQSPPPVPADLAEHVIYPTSPPSATEETRP